MVEEVLLALSYPKLGLLDGGAVELLPVPPLHLPRGWSTDKLRRSL